MLAVRNQSPPWPGAAFWTAWFVANALIGLVLGALLPVQSRNIAGLFAVAYPLFFGAAQGLMLASVTPARWRAVAVGGVALAVIFVHLDTALIVNDTVTRIWGFPRGSAAVAAEIVSWLAAMAGAAAAGLMHWWILAGRVRSPGRLILLHVVLALGLALAAVPLLDIVRGWGAWRNTVPFGVRAAFGVSMGLIAGLSVFLVLKREVSWESPAASEPSWTGRAEREVYVVARPLVPRLVVLWLLLHAAVLAAINVFFVTAPRSPLFAAFLYGPTIGLVQAILLWQQFAPAASPWRRWIVPTALVPTAATVASVPLILVAISATTWLLHLRPPIVMNPAGLPTMWAEYPLYFPPVVTGLTIGWLSWRQLRTLSRGQLWSALFLAAEGLAPLVMVGVAHSSPSLMPGYRPPITDYLERSSIYTMAAAAEAGLVVALLVGTAAWLAFGRGRRED